MVSSDKKMRIVFMGTPDFAAVCLKSILDSTHEVVGVVTAPDRQAGRGRKINESAVKTLASQNGLDIAQPEKLRDNEFLELLKSWNADLFVVVAFRMLPEVVWDMTPRGTINLHASLLPQFRGAAPIQRAIMAGADQSGATIFRLTHKIDTGDIIDRVALDIGPNETAGSLHDRILKSGKDLLVDCLDVIAGGEFTATSQDNVNTEKTKLLQAPKIFKEDRRINWCMSSQEVHNHVRGLSPYPCATTTIKGEDKSQIKVLEGRMFTELIDLEAGEVNISGSKLIVGTGDGAYEITRLQPAGKSAMDAASFVRGLRDGLDGFR
jgi:methionyl-tRNA formyltransferase